MVEEVRPDSDSDKRFLPVSWRLIYVSPWRPATSFFEGVSRWDAMRARGSAGETPEGSSCMHESDSQVAFVLSACVVGAPKATSKETSSIMRRIAQICINKAPAVIRDPLITRLPVASTKLVRVILELYSRWRYAGSNVAVEGSGRSLRSSKMFKRQGVASLQTLAQYQY